MLYCYRRSSRSPGLHHSGGFLAPHGIEINCKPGTAGGRFIKRQRHRLFRQMKWTAPEAEKPLPGGLLALVKKYRECIK